MTEPLNRADDPPPPGPEIRVYKVLPKVGFTGQILSPWFWGVYIHWDGHRSRECTLNPEKCVGHQLGMPIRWKGYLTVWHSAERKIGFLECTPALAEKIKDLVPEKHLRGYVLICHRSGEAKNGRINITQLHPAHGPIENLPQNLDPEETLRKLWGWGRAK